MSACLLCFILLACLVPLHSAASTQLINPPSYIPSYTDPCKRHSPDFNSCVKKTLQSIIPKLSKRGLPEMGVPTLDPLFLRSMSFSYNSLPDIGGRMVINNSTATGLANVRIISVRSSIVEKKSFSVDMELSVPRVLMRGHFTMAGRIGVFPVSGSGPYNLTTGEVRGSWRLRGTPVTVDGVEFIRLKHFLVRPTVSFFKVEANNMVSGNPHINKLVMNFMNRFWHLLYEQSLPDFEANLDLLGRDILNKIFLSVPYDQLFPPYQKTTSTTTPRTKRKSG